MFLTKEQCRARLVRKIAELAGMAAAMAVLEFILAMLLCM